ncbi:hypothetical protein MATL_G00053310 [Megalops atlanticus]|uniref:Uncharacterized protein n=1 Tax=Megalops atlanticus TaxID=7932 RepID=A0A9D3TB27_MEGAT|nr:hypothetical protein MATL_G00053310 [Megalops atlanticus]
MQSLVSPGRRQRLHLAGVIVDRGYESVKAKMQVLWRPETPPTPADPQQSHWPDGDWCRDVWSCAAPGIIVAGLCCD